MNAVRWTIFGVTTIGVAVAACAWRVAADAPHAPSFDLSFAPKNASAGPRFFAGKVESTCPARSGANPAICVGPPARTSYGRGDPITTRIVWRGVPANSSVVVYLVRDQPDETRGSIRYLGTTGALTVDAIPISGDGAIDFAWNGREFACAPSDMPMLCRETANIGRYRIAAILYARARVSVVGWPDPNPPAILAVSTSSAFVVRGSPDLSDIARTLWWAAMDQAMARHEITTSATLGDMSGRNVTFYQRGDRLCAKIPAIPPYQSTLESCVPMAKIIGDAGLLPVDKADTVVTGHVRVMPGALSRERAVNSAKDAAARPYLPRVAFRHQPSFEEAGYKPGAGGGAHSELDDREAWDNAHPTATTYLNDGPRDTIYRPDLGGGWVVVMDEILAGGRIPDSQRFADKVLVFVNANGKACVIETRKYKGEDFSRDPRTALFTCS